MVHQGDTLVMKPMPRAGPKPHPAEHRTAHRLDVKARSAHVTVNLRSCAANTPSPDEGDDAFDSSPFNTMPREDTPGTSELREDMPGPSEPGTPRDTPGPIEPSTPRDTPGPIEPGTPENMPASEPGTPENMPASEPGTPENMPGPRDPGTPPEDPGPSIPGTPQKNMFEPRDPSGPGVPDKRESLSERLLRMRGNRAYVADDGADSEISCPSSVPYARFTRIRRYRERKFGDL
jgi:hypothetical protein